MKLGMLKVFPEKWTESSEEENDIHPLFFSPENQTNTIKTLVMENFSPDILARIIKNYILIL